MPPARRPVLPIWKRKEVFDCSCCPPNINRFTASLANVIFTETEQGVYINQFISSEFAGMSITTDYPNDNVIIIRLGKYNYSKLFVRVPSWADGFEFYTNGKTLKAQVKKGYAEIPVNSDCEIKYTLDFVPQWLITTLQGQVWRLS